MNYDEQELLNYALSHGMIDIANIRSGVTMTKREEILSKHSHKIWQGKDNKWRTYIHAEGYPKNLKLICKTTREALEDVIVEAYEEEENVHTFEEVFNDWNHRRLEYNMISPRTHCIYVEIFDRFLKNNIFAKKDITTISPLDWQNFLENLCYKTNKVQYMLFKTMVKQTLTRAKKLGYIKYSISEIFETLEDDEHINVTNKLDESKEIYTKSEFETIKKYIIKNPKLNYFGVLLIFVSGVRAGELTALTYDDLYDDYILRIRKTVSVKLDKNGNHSKFIKDSPKTINGIRDIPIPDDYHWVIDKIKSYKKDDMTGRELIFKNPKVIRYALQIICKKCNIPYRPPHKIRKTYCTTMLDNNVNPKVVAKLAGHGNKSLTLTVYNIDQSNFDERKNDVNRVFNTD